MTRSISRTGLLFYRVLPSFTGFSRLFVPHRASGGVGRAGAELRNVDRHRLHVRFVRHALLLRGRHRLRPAQKVTNRSLSSSSLLSNWEDCNSRLDYWASELGFLPSWNLEANYQGLCSMDCSQFNEIRMKDDSKENCIDFTRCRQQCRASAATMDKSEYSLRTIAERMDYYQHQQQQHQQQHQHQNANSNANRNYLLHHQPTEQPLLASRSDYSLRRQSGGHCPAIDYGRRSTNLNRTTSSSLNG